MNLLIRCQQLSIWRRTTAVVHASHVFATLASFIIRRTSLSLVQLNPPARPSQQQGYQGKPAARHKGHMALRAVSSRRLLYYIPFMY